MKQSYIRITSCLRPNYKIGKVYKVIEENKGAFLYIVDIINGKYKCIEIIDTEPVQISIGSKVKVKKYKGQDLHGVPEAEYRMLVGKELTVDYISEDSMLCRVDNMAYSIHESLVKPVMKQ